MKIKQIRNATIRIEYAGKTFLVDPWLEKKHGLGSFEDIPGRPFHVPDPVKEHLPMPFCDLPEPTEAILRGIDYYILTHIHPDHIDMAIDGTVGAPLDTSVPIIAQNEADADVLKKSGFQHIEILSENPLRCGEASITKAPARHGTVVPCGDACGVIFESGREKTLYVAGDTIWYDGVQNTIQKYTPDVVVMNACAAELVGNGRLIMNDEDVACVADAAPNAQLVVSHMDNVAHASITRHSMRGLLAQRGIKEYFIPEDGETLAF